MTLTHLVALEDRVLFDAAPMLVDAEVAQSVDLLATDIDSGELATGDDWSSLFLASDGNHTDNNSESEIVERLDALTEWSSWLDESYTENGFSMPTELVVIDRSVEDFQTLLGEDFATRLANREYQLVFVDASEDGVDLISQSLDLGASLGHQYQAIHVVSHGADGNIILGSGVLNGDSLDSYRDRLASWADGLTSDADILFYGCNVAESKVGESLLENIGMLTGADVAASVDRTGHEELQGDWSLEFAYGDIDSQSFVVESAHASWYSTLSMSLPIKIGIGDVTDIQVTSQFEQGNKQAIAMDNSGNYVVVWSDDAADGSGWGVYAELFDSDGNSVDRFRVNQNINGDQQWASVDMDATGNFVVTWTDDSDNDVMARRFSSDGTALGNEFRVNKDADLAYGSMVSVNQHGEFVVAWQGEGSGDSTGIYAKLYNKDGSLVRDVFRVNDWTFGTQEHVDVSMNSDGDFVVVWDDFGGVQAKRFDSDGSADGGQKTLAANNGFAKTYYYFADVELGDNGNYVATYTRSMSSDESIAGGLFNGSNNKFNSFTVNKSAVSSQSFSSIMLNQSGGFNVVWSGYGNQLGQEDLDGGVFMRQYDATGTAISSEYRVNSFTAGSQHFASVAGLGTHQYAVVWSGQGTGDTDGVFIGLSKTNLPPTASNGAIDMLDGIPYVLSANDFNYSDPEGDSFQQVQITGIPSNGYLVLDGATILSNGDTVSVSAINAGRLAYYQASSGYGAAYDSFNFKVHDGNQYSNNANTLQVNISPTDVLLFSTDVDVEDDGPPELPAWESEDILTLGGTNLQLGPSTDGELSITFSLTDFIGQNTDIDAFHVVTTQMTLGNTFQMTVNPGDIIFSVGGNVSLPGIGAVDKDDVLLFRPAGNDYSNGTFSILLDFDSLGVTDPDLDMQNIRSITLVESNTVVGDVGIRAGEMLFTRNGKMEGNDIYRLSIQETGIGTTVASADVLIDGNEIGINKKIHGIELVEQRVEVGGVTLDAGSLLLSLNKGEKVGDNQLSVDSEDIFALNVTKTTLGSGAGQAAATASMIFDGSDLNIDDEGESVDGLAIVAYPDNNPPNVSPQNFGAYEMNQNGDVIGVVSANDPDISDTITFEVIGGTGAQVFDVDPNSGQIMVTDASQLGSSPSFTLDVAVRDNQGGVNFATMTIDINLAPESSDVSVSLAEDDLYQFSLSDFSFTDADSDSMSHVYVQTLPAQGQLLLNGSPISAGQLISVASIASGHFEFQPPQDANGLPFADFKFRVADGNQLSSSAYTLQIHVTPENDAPDIDPQMFTALQNSVNGDSVGFVTASDVDAGDTLSFQVIGGSGQGVFQVDSSTGEITIANASQLGTLSTFHLNVKVTDSQGEIDTAVITIDINDAPVSTDTSVTTNEDQTYVFGLSDFPYSDFESDPLAYVTIEFLPLKGELLLNGNAVAVDQAVAAADIAAGKLTYVPPPTEYGDALASFGFQVSDGNQNSLSTYLMEIDVISTNVDPILNVPRNINVAENQTSVGTVRATDGDPDTLTFRLGSSADESLFVIDPATGKLSFAAPPDYENPLDGDGNNVYRVQVIVQDGHGGGDSEFINIRVNPVNDNLPQFQSPSSAGIDENTTAVMTVSATDADLPMDTITYTIDNGFGDGGLFSIHPSTGELVFDAAPNFENPLDFDGDNVYQVKVIANDGRGGMSQQVISVAINDVNEPIDSLSLDNTELAENSPGGTRVGFIQVVDQDQNDNYTFTLLDDASGKFTIDSATGEVTVVDGAVLDFETVAHYVIQVQVVDQGGFSLTEFLNIDLTNVNETPVVAGESFVVLEAGQFNSTAGFALLNDSDPDGDTLTASVVAGPSHGVLNWNTDGSFTYTHDGSETTVDQFTYRVSDGNGGFQDAVVSIQVTPVNDAPVATDDMIIMSGETIVITPEELLFNDVDPDSTQLSIAVVSQPSHGTLTAQPDGSFLFKPDGSESGLVTFTYTVTDGDKVSQQATVTMVMASGQPSQGDTDPDSQGDNETNEPVDPEPEPDQNPGGPLGRNGKPNTGSTDPDQSSGSHGGSHHSHNSDHADESAGLDAFQLDSTQASQQGDQGLLSTNYAFAGSRAGTEVSSLLAYSNDAVSSITQLTSIDTQSMLSLVLDGVNSLNDDIVGNVDVSSSVATAASLTGVFTVGYVLWMARGGMLVASLISSMPAWQTFDPLPILQFSAENNDDEDGDSLESLVSQDSHSE